MLTIREVVLVELEANYNIDPVPTAATDAVLVSNFKWANEGLKMIARPTVKNTLGERQHVFAGSLRSFSFDVQVRGSGAAGTAPEIGKLLQACAMVEVVNAGASVVYSPASDGIKSVTMYYYQDGNLHKLTGCRGNASFNLTAGNEIKATFKMSGHDAGFSAAALPAATYDSAQPIPSILVPFSIGGYSAIIDSLAVDLGNKIATPGDMSAADSYGEIRITGRNVNGSFNPEAVLQTTKDFEADFKAGTVMALDTGVIGATPGNQIEFAMPKVYYTDTAPGDRTGIAIYDQKFGALETAGDDEITITFT